MADRVDERYAGSKGGGCGIEPCLNGSAKFSGPHLENERQRQLDRLATDGLVQRVEQKLCLSISIFR